MIDLWLDDVRPAPPGWTLVTTADQAAALLATGTVRRCSLDHDLGFILAADGQRLYLAGYQEGSIPDGSALVRWIVETGHWPAEKPNVHSANPVGSRYMRQMIDRYWPDR